MRVLPRGPCTFENQAEEGISVLHLLKVFLLCNPHVSVVIQRISKLELSPPTHPFTAHEQHTENPHHQPTRQPFEYLLYPSVDRPGAACYSDLT